MGVVPAATENVQFPNGVAPLERPPDVIEITVFSS
jgi:hypothetical protein